MENKLKLMYIIKFQGNLNAVLLCFIIAKSVTMKLYNKK